MTRKEIIDWLNYWQNRGMVSVDNICAFDQVHEARKYCLCMRIGVFRPHLVTDLQIWRALCEMRREQSAA